MRAVPNDPSRERLVKSRERVRDLAEVYTASREVRLMLDQIDTGLPGSVFQDLDATFLEPAAGNGNFLAAILRRKLRLVQYRTHCDTTTFEFDCLRAVASIYGIDICEENVLEARSRLKGIVNEHYSHQVSAFFPEPRFQDALDEILRTNVILGDTLEGGDQIAIVEYRPRTRRQFRRVVHQYSHLIRGGSQATIRMAPTGYLNLARTPAPTTLSAAATA